MRKEPWEKYEEVPKILFGERWKIVRSETRR